MAESYTVLARRYRSQSFDELIGQEAIAQTLRNAITSNRVAHAFLFTGTRGVGKTSSARILAKALNCPHAQKGVPCNACDTCKAIARGEDMDVIEIDGASNNGVDNIRELRQAAGIRPAHSRYKIYIIDEVHMVTMQAFNALLKTLEEPPEHVKFIFATTDVQKVPATILSRCQRFDFKPIPVEKIADHLADVCQKEGVQADGDAVHRIARLGNGSMRDALSLLDRVLSLGEKHITDQLLDDLLGKPPTAAIAELVAALAEQDAAAALKRADALLKGGMGVEQLLGELIEFFRNLMLLTTCGDQTDLVDVPADVRPTLGQIAGKYDPPSLVHLVALCEQALRAVKGSTMVRPLFDALIVRLALSEQFSAIKQLLQQTSTSPAPAPGQKKNDIDSPDAPDEVSDDGPPLDILAADEAELSFAAQMKAQLANAARPVAGQRNGTAVAVAPAVVELVADPTNAAAVWDAAQRHLTANRAASIKMMLTGKAHLARCDGAEAVLALASTLQSYAGEKVKARIEESLRAVTGKPLKLTLSIYEAAEEARPQGPAGTAARVPPEVIEAVRASPVVRKIMEKLGGDVSHVELLDADGGA